MTETVIPREDLATLDLTDVTTGERLPLTTPAEVLREEFMRPLGLSARSLARNLRVPTNRVTAILHESRAITADTALRLARRFGTSAEFWMNLQVHHDREVARARQIAA